MKKELAISSSVHKRQTTTRYYKTAVRKENSRFLPEIALVVNPNSCSGLTGKNWESLYAKIRESLGNNLEVVFSRKQGDGTYLTRKLLKRGVKKIVAIGGDGTINEVANGFFEDPVGIYRKKERSVTTKEGEMMPSASSPQLINTDAILAVVSAGSRNVIAKSLDLPQGLTQSCSTVSLGQPRRIDVVSATVTNPVDHSTANTRILVNAAEIGFGAEISDRSRKVRKVLNSRLISTVTSVIATVPSYQSNECEILFSRRKKLVAKMTMGIVANGKFIGGGFKVAPRASMFDGLLDVVILKDSGSLKMLGELANIKSGNYSEDKNIFYRQSRRVAIRSNERDVTVTIDGETVGILPATFEIVPKALSIQM